MSDRDKAQDELNDAHQHADPAKGGKKVDGGDLANIDDVDKGADVAEKDKAL